MKGITQYIYEGYYDSEYQKAMHSMYLDWLNLAHKKELTDDEAMDLYDLQHSLKKDNWFAYEREVKRQKNLPWKITPQDTPEQRKRDERWAPILAVYTTLQNYIQDVDINREILELMKHEFYSGDLKDIQTYMQGEVKHSVKKNHDYQVPRQLENPSQKCLDCLNLVNTIAMVNNSLKDNEHYKDIEVNFKQQKEKNAFNIAFAYKDEEADKATFEKIVDKLISDMKDQIKDASLLKIMKGDYYIADVGNEIGNDFYFTDLRNAQAAASADEKNISRKGESYYIIFPVLEFVK